MLSLAPDYFSQRLIALLRMNDQIPPFYYVLLNAWMHLFGTSVAALRALPLLASVASVPHVYALGRTLHSSRRMVCSADFRRLPVPGRLRSLQSAVRLALLLRGRIDTGGRARESRRLVVALGGALRVDGDARSLYALPVRLDIDFSGRLCRLVAPP